MVDDLLDIVTLEDEENDNANDMDGMNFVITGSVNHFSNRSELLVLSLFIRYFVFDVTLPVTLPPLPSISSFTSLLFEK